MLSFPIIFFIFFINKYLKIRVYDYFASHNSTQKLVCNQLFLFFGGERDFFNYFFLKIKLLQNTNMHTG